MITLIEWLGGSSLYLFFGAYRGRDWYFKKRAEWIDNYKSDYPNHDPIKAFYTADEGPIWPWCCGALLIFTWPIAYFLKFTLLPFYTFFDKRPHISNYEKNLELQKREEKIKAMEKELSKAL